MVSLSKSWVKVQVKGGDTVSFRPSEVTPAKAPGNAAKTSVAVAPARAVAPPRVSPLGAGPPGSYPQPTEASSRGLHASKAASALGAGVGAAGGSAAGKLVAAVVQHEVEHVRASSVAAARPLADLLERVGQAAAAAVPEAVAAARSRRILGAAAGRERDLTVRLEGLKREEQAWAALDASDDPMSLIGGESEGDDDDNSDDDDDEDEVQESGPGFDLVVGKGDVGATEAAEKAELALTEIYSSVMKLKTLTESAAEAERHLATSNKAHHFDSDSRVTGGGKDAKTHIRGLSAKPKGGS